MTEVLLEKYLASQFKFGFELEAFLNQGRTDYRDEWDDGDETNVRSYLKVLMAYTFGLSNEVMDLKLDGSLRPSDEDDYAFEWATPVMDFTPTNLDKCIKGLDKLVNKKGIYTNDSCGFHVHLSFPDLSDKDLIWIISQLSIDTKIIDDLLDFHGMNFVDDEYASIDSLDYIGHMIKQEKYHMISRHFTTEKYNAFRIHPQGTLEWRGPRNFLNTRDVKLIKDFFKLLHRFVRWISDAISATSINGVSKENFFQMVFGDKYSKDSSIIDNIRSTKSRKTMDRIAEIIENNKYQVLVKLLQQYMNTKDEKIMKIIDMIVYQLFSYTYSNSNQFMAHVLDELMAKKLEAELGLILKKIHFQHDFSHILIMTQYSTFSYLMSLLLPVEHQRMLDILRSLMSIYYEQGAPHTKLMKFLTEYGSMLDMEDWNYLFKPLKVLIKFSDLVTNSKMVDSAHLVFLFTDCLTRTVRSNLYQTRPDFYKMSDFDWIMINHLIDVCKTNMVLLNIVKNVLKSIIQSNSIITAYALKDTSQKMIDIASELLEKLYN